MDVQDNGERELQRDQMQSVKLVVPPFAAGDRVPAIERQQHEPKVNLAAPGDRVD